MRVKEDKLAFIGRLRIPIRVISWGRPFTPDIRPLKAKVIKQGCFGGSQLVLLEKLDAEV